MSDWRDDLPEIPSDRILRAAIHEGHRRRETRRQRLQAVMFGGMGVGAIALLISFGALVSTGGDDDDDSGAADTAGETLTAGTEAPGTTAAPTATSPEETTAATEATSGTEAPGTTGAPGTTAAAADTTSPDYTTIGGPIAGEPPSGAVTVDPTEIWEQPPDGSDCGPTQLTVEFGMQTQAPQTPVVHSEVAGVQGEAPMDVDGDRATATIGPFPADTLDDGAIHEVLVYVTDQEAFGDRIFRAPTVLLRDCSP
jgi:hypothetical protein